MLWFHILGIALFQLEVAMLTTFAESETTAIA